MQTDLFLKSKKEQLLEWLRYKKRAFTHEVIAWGLDHHTNRADRDCRDLAQEGYIKRMSAQDKTLYYSGIKEEVWLYTGKI